MKNQIIHTITVNNPDAWTDKKQVKVTMSFENVPVETLQEWALSNRVIALQRVLRELTEEGIDELAVNGLVVHALNAGQKIRTQAEIIATAKAQIAALPAELRDALLKELGAAAD